MECSGNISLRTKIVKLKAVDAVLVNLSQKGTVHPDQFLLLSNVIAH